MQKQPVALIGCGLLALGVFAPVVHIPLAGGLSYLEVGRNGTPVGWITLGVAGAALLATLARAYSLLWIAGAASLALEWWAFAHVRKTVSAVREVADEAEGLGRSILGAFGGAMQMQWGWPVIAAGGIALLIAAGMQAKEDAESPVAPPPTTDNEWAV